MNGQPEPPPQHQLSSSWRSREPSLGFILKTSTWLSDSHGLYDYESRNVSAKTYKCYGRHGNYRVLRRGEDVSLVTERLAREILASDSNVQTVVKITTTTQGIPGYSIQAGNYSEDQGIAAEKYNSANPLDGGKVGLPAAIQVEEHRSKDLTCHTSKDNRDIWVVCRSLRDGLLPLKQGTVLRFGRYLTRVKELVRDEVDSERLASCGGLAVSDSEGDEVVRPPTVGRSGNVEIRGSASSPPNDLLDLVVGGPQLIGERPEDDEGNTTSPGRNVELNSEHCLDRVSYLHDTHVNPSLDECHDSRSGEFVIGGINIVSRATQQQRIDQEGDSTDHESIYNSAASSILQTTPRRKAADDVVLRLPSSLEDTVSVTAKICRVCLCEQECDSNPVISACKCKGSMKGIHLECLRTWMRGRLNIKSTESNTCYYWRPLECELCKEPYPKYVDLIHPNERISKQTALMALKQNPPSSPSDDRELVELLALPRPKPPYIVLETRQEGLPFSRGYHFVSFSDADKASLGRGHEVDIKIADISVSRIHALLRYQPKREYYANVLRDYPFQRYTKRTHPREVCDLLGEFHDPKTLEKPYFYVEDLRSKFGTLIESPDPIHLFPRMSISIQVGRSVLTFFMARPSWSWFPMRPSGLHLPYRLRFRRKKPAHVLSSGGEANASGSIDWHEVERMDVRIVESFLPLSLYTNNTINSRHNTISNQDGASQQLPSGNVAQ